MEQPKLMIDLDHGRHSDMPPVAVGIKSFQILLAALIVKGT